MRFLYRTLLLIIFGLALSACGDRPDRAWQMTEQGAYSAALSLDARHALIGSIQHGGSLWQLEENARIYNWNHTAGEFSSFVAVAFSSDGTQGLTAEKFRLVMWDVASGSDRGFWQLDAGIRALAASDQGVFLLVGLDNYTVQYMETRNGSILRTLNHAGRINSVAISANGRVGVSGAEDGLVKIWNLIEGRVLHQYRLGDDIATVAVSRDGRLAFGALYYGRGKIWDVESGKEIGEVGFSRNTLTAARFSADNKQLLTGDASRRAIIWNIDTAKVVVSRKVRAPEFFRPSGRVIVDVAFGKTPGSLYAIYSDGSAAFWK
jgi:WD40 repeat protein